MTRREASERNRDVGAFGRLYPGLSLRTPTDVGDARVISEEFDDGATEDGGEAFQEVEGRRRAPTEHTPELRTAYGCEVGEMREGDASGPGHRADVAREETVERGHAPTLGAVDALPCPIYRLGDEQEGAGLDVQAPRSEPTAAELSEELRALAKCPDVPQLRAMSLTRKALWLAKAPAGRSPSDWLRASGDETATAASDFYTPSRSGTWPTTRQRAR